MLVESTSEWSSAPELIRKEDGNVPWCIDNRALDNVPVKYTFPLQLLVEHLGLEAGRQFGILIS